MKKDKIDNFLNVLSLVVIVTISGYLLYRINDDFQKEIIQKEESLQKTRFTYCFYSEKQLKIIAENAYSMKKKFYRHYYNDVEFTESTTKEVSNFDDAKLVAYFITNTFDEFRIRHSLADPVEVLKPSELETIIQADLETIE